MPLKESLLLSVWVSKVCILQEAEAKTSDSLCASQCCSLSVRKHKAKLSSLAPVLVKRNISV